MQQIVLIVWTISTNYNSILRTSIWTYKCIWSNTTHIYFLYPTKQIGYPFFYEVKSCCIVCKKSLFFFFEELIVEFKPENLWTFQLNLIVNSLVPIDQNHSQRIETKGLLKLLSIVPTIYASLTAYIVRERERERDHQG